LLILGAAALVAPLSVQGRIVKVDVPMICAAAVGLWLLALDGALSRLDGLLLFAVLVVYLVWSVRQGRGEDNGIKQQRVDPLVTDDQGRVAAGQGAGSLIRQGLLVVIGLILLVAAARSMVTGASEIARGLGVSELVIGLTLVALGTSLPELVASALASLRGQGDIAVGNVVGSNLFNILAVLGIGAMVAPGGIPVSADVLHQDLPIMIAASLVCVPIFFTEARVTRMEGLLLLGYYIAYIAYVTMGATDAAYIRGFELVMLGCVIPLTTLAIAAGVYRSLRAEQMP
jgi:cation:H+ antiporter